MSDTNRVRVSIARTSQRGGSGVDPVPVDPANFTPASNLYRLRYTGAPGLGSQPNSIVSNEIRSDRQTPDQILVGTEAGGSLEVELSALTFDDLIQATLTTNFKNTHRVAPAGMSWTGNNEVTLVTGFTSNGVLANSIVRVVLPAEGIDDVYYVSAKVGDVATLTAYTSTAPTIPIAADDTGGEIIVCGVRADTAGDVSIALNTPVAGQATITFANEVAAMWAAAYPNVAGSAHTLPVVGNWIKLAGMVDDIQNLYGRLIAVTATTAVITQPTGLTATAATGNPAVFWGDMLRNPILEPGTTPANIGQFAPTSIAANSFLIERRYEDHSPITRELLLGCAVNQLGLTLDPQSILVATFEFFGFKSNVSDDSPNYADVYTTLPTDVDATETSVLNTSTNVGRVSISADNILSGDVSSALNLPLQVQINIGNNLRRRNAVGVFGAASIGAGRYNIGGNINTYFDSKQILELIVRNTDAEYTTSVSSNDGRGYLIDLPRIKFGSGAPDVPGGDQDAVLNPNYTALLSSFGYTIHLTRWGYVA